MHAGGGQKMISISRNSRQPVRDAWSLERLNTERSILLGMALDPSTALTYTSALNSYLTFCKTHGMLVEPTPQTLSYYVTFQSWHINPKSVDSYLSGISSQLEVYFPDVRKNRLSPLVARTLAGAKRVYGKSTNRKSPLLVTNLITISEDLANSSNHDDFLFDAQVICGFCGFHRLAEITQPDKLDLRAFRKLVMRHTLEWLAEGFAYWLPTHKADATFEGNKIIIKQIVGAPDPYPKMDRYIRSRDHLFPNHPQLWLKMDGTVPTRSWFISRMRKYFGAEISGQSLRSGAATALAEAGAPPDLIMGAGRWKSNSWTVYIRKNPILLHAMILSRTAHYTQNNPAPSTR